MLQKAVTRLGFLHFPSFHSCGYRCHTRTISCLLIFSCLTFAPLLVTLLPSRPSLSSLPPPPSLLPTFLLPSRYCGEAFRWDHILAINKHTTKEEREKFGTDHMEDGDEIVPTHKIIIPQPDRDHSTKVCNETLQDSRVGPNFEF